MFYFDKLLVYSIMKTPYTYLKQLCKLFVICLKLFLVCTGGGAYWTGRTVAFPHFAANRQAKHLALPFLGPRSDNLSWYLWRKWAVSVIISLKVRKFVHHGKNEAKAAYLAYHNRGFTISPLAP